MRNTKTHKQTIELINNILTQYNIDAKERKMTKGKHEWENSVVYLWAIENMCYIDIFVVENKNFHENKNKVSIHIYKENSPKYIIKDLLINQYKTTEQYFDAIKEGLTNALNSLNTLNI